MSKIKKWAAICVGVICVIVLLRLFFFTSYYISSNAMAPKLYAGDQVLVHKTTAEFLQKGDIAFLANPLDASSSKVSSTFVGTIIGAPGDTVWVDSAFNLVDLKQGTPLYKELFAISTADKEKLEAIIARYGLNIIPLKSNKTECYYTLNSYEAFLISEMDEDILKPINNKVDSDKHYPIILPKSKSRIQITPWNRSFVYNAILLHEPNAKVTLVNDVICLNGSPIESYEFKNNYYWIGVYDAYTMSDSSVYGFVPDTYITGSPLFIWFSKTPNTPFWKGYNWERFFSKCQ